MQCRSRIPFRLRPMVRALEVDVSMPGAGVAKHPPEDLADGAGVKTPYATQSENVATMAYEDLYGRRGKRDRPAPSW